VGAAGVELLLFRGPVHRRGRRVAALDDLGDFVEVAGADFLLVRHEGVARSRAANSGSCTFST